MTLTKPTSALLKECKKNKLKTPMHKAFCDLILAGWNKEDAYGFSGLWNPTYSQIMNMQDMNHLLNEDKNIIKYITEKTKQQQELETKARQAEENTGHKHTEQLGEIDMTTELSKETQLKELLLAKQKFPVGSKEWLDVKKMIADISRVKQDDMQDDIEVVHFYVPLQCHDCALYEAQKKKLKKQ